MLDLIIKNGQCYINGNLENKDIAIKDKATGDSQFYNIKKEIRKKIIDQKEFKVLDDWFNDLRENAYISIRI